VDLVDGTPVLDVKPYVPYADAVPDATAAWADAPPPHQPVRFDASVEGALADRPALRALIEQTLRLDPRPAHARQVSARDWALQLGDVDVRWVVDAGGARVVAVAPR
ncbi:MAG: SAM-dependent methyltransferase, partial [Myxococcales bacterium]|nr:SAM-dependent methyltransferase [Myxococcales bacterium]